MTSPTVPGPICPLTLPIFPVRLRSTFLCTMSLGFRCSRCCHCCHCCRSLGAGLLRRLLDVVLAVLQGGGKPRQERAGLGDDPAHHAVESVGAVEHRELVNVSER